MDKKTREQYLSEVYLRLPSDTLMDCEGFLSYMHNVYKVYLPKGQRPLDLPVWLSGGYKRCENKAITNVANTLLDGG